MAINRIQNKSVCLHYMCLCTAYIYCVCIYTCMYIFSEKIIFLNINIFIYNKQLYAYKYRHVHVNIFNIYAVCVYLYIHNKYTQNKHTYIMQTKLLFWMRLITINCLTTLIYLFIRTLRKHLFIYFKIHSYWFINNFDVIEWIVNIYIYYAITSYF